MGVMKAPQVLEGPGCIESQAAVSGRQKQLCLGQPRSAVWVRLVEALLWMLPGPTSQQRALQRFAALIPPPMQSLAAWCWQAWPQIPIHAPERSSPLMQGHSSKA